MGGANAGGKSGTQRQDKTVLGVDEPRRTIRTTDDQCLTDRRCSGRRFGSGCNRDVQACGEMYKPWPRFCATSGREDAHARRCHFSSLVIVDVSCVSPHAPRPGQRLNDAGFKHPTTHTPDGLAPADYCQASPVLTSASQLGAWEQQRYQPELFVSRLAALVVVREGYGLIPMANSVASCIEPPLSRDHQLNMSPLGSIQSQCRRQVTPCSYSMHHALSDA